MPLRSPTFGIRHSAAFRMTLRFTAFFIAGLVVVGLVAGLIARTNIERSARAAASDMVQDLAASYAHFTPEDFARYLEGIAGALSEDGVFVGYQAPGGEPLSGAITLPRPTTGWSDYLVDGSDVDEILWVRTERLPDGHWLSVGATTEYYNDAVELMTDGVLWVVAISVPLALFSGALLSRMVLSRLDDLSGTAEAVSAGDLSQRAPLRGTADEFDRLAGNLNRMLDHNETLTRNLRNVSVGIAHELRTPLARLRMRLEEMQVSRGDKAHGDALIARSLEDIDQTLATFNALLKIGQVEANTVRSDFEALDFSGLVSELAEIYEPVVSESGRTLSARLDAGVEIEGNRALLTQMISNLLENAIDHTPPGTEIEITLRGGETSALTVTDNGPGIPAELADKVFEPFIHGEHRKDGTGLGLALVRSICALHGFKLSIPPGERGAGFSIEV